MGWKREHNDFKALQLFSPFHVKVQKARPTRYDTLQITIVKPLEGVISRAP
jgi:hypothetical protein